MSKKHFACAYKYNFCEISCWRRMWNVCLAANVKYCSFVAMWNKIRSPHAAGVFHICKANISHRRYFTRSKGTNFTEKSTHERAFFMVRATGLEPVRCHHRGILSPLRLPISPRPHIINRRNPKALSAVNIILYYPMFVNKFVFFTLPFRTGRRSGAPVRASCPWPSSSALLCCARFRRASSRYTLSSPHTEGS